MVPELQESPPVQTGLRIRPVRIRRARGLKGGQERPQDQRRATGVLLALKISSVLSALRHFTYRKAQIWFAFGGKCRLLFFKD